MGGAACAWHLHLSSFLRRLHGPHFWRQHVRRNVGALACFQIFRLVHVRRAMSCPYSRTNHDGVGSCCGAVVAAAFWGLAGVVPCAPSSFDQLAFLVTTWAPGPHRCAQHSSTHSILHICWCAVGLWRLARRRLMLNLQLSPSGSSALGLASSNSPASSWSRGGCPQGRADALGGSSTYPMTVVGRALVPVPRHPVVFPHSPSAFHRCSASAAGLQGQGVRKSPATAIAIERPHASANGQRLPRPRQRLVQQAWRDAPPFAGVGWSLMSASQRMCLTS